MSSARSPRIWWEMASNWFQIKFEGVFEYCRMSPPGFGQTSKAKTPTVVTLSIPADLFKSIRETHPAPVAHDMRDPPSLAIRPAEPSRILLEMDIRALEEIRDTANAILAFDHEEWIRNQPYLEEPSALARRMTMDEIVAYRDKMAQEYIGRGTPVPREVEEWWPR